MRWSARATALCGLMALAVSACQVAGGPTSPGGELSRAAGVRAVQAVGIIIPRFDAAAHRQPGCYRHAGQRLKFRIATVDSDDAQAWRDEAAALSTDCDWSAMWDGKWYYQPLRSDEPHTLVIAWKNVTTGDSDFIAIRHAPPHFVVAGQGGELGQLKDGGRKVFPFKSGKAAVNVDVEDMPDDAVWKPNEVKWRILH